MFAIRLDKFSLLHTTIDSINGNRGKRVARFTINFSYRGILNDPRSPSVAVKVYKKLFDIGMGDGRQYAEIEAGIVCD